MVALTEKSRMLQKVHNDNFDNGTPHHKVKLPDTYMDRTQVHDKVVRFGRSLEKEVLDRVKGAR